MADLLIEGGVVQFLNGAPLFGPDFDCCCGPLECPCCAGDLECCYGFTNFSVTADCGFIGLPNLAISWQWVTAADGGCLWIWEINYHYGRDGVASRYNFPFPPSPSCTAVDGVYFPGSFFQQFEFDYTFDPLSFKLCDWRNATVEIEKDGQGYWFTIRGLVNHPNGFCDDCNLLDGAYYVPCFPV